MGECYNVLIHTANEKQSQYSCSSLMMLCRMSSVPSSFLNLTVNRWCPEKYAHRTPDTASSASFLSTSPLDILWKMPPLFFPVWWSKVFRSYNLGIHQQLVRVVLRRYTDRPLLFYQSFLFFTCHWPIIYLLRFTEGRGLNQRTITADSCSGSYIMR